MIVESNGNSRIVKKPNSRPNSRILNSRLAPLVRTPAVADNAVTELGLARLLGVAAARY